MLIFESTKTNTPTPHPYFEISAPHVRTQPWHKTIAETSEDDTSIFKQKTTRISCAKRSKINVTHLLRRNATSASDALFCLTLQDCLTAYRLQVCFGTRADAVVKSIFQKSLSAPLNPCRLSYQASLLRLESEPYGAVIITVYENDYKCSMFYRL